MKNNIFIFTICVAIVASVITTLTVDRFVSNSNNIIGQNRQQKSKLIVHISSDVSDQHSVMMGLMKAKQSVEMGSEVLVYFDVKATKVVMKDKNFQFADFVSSHDMIKEIISKGGSVYVCPHCLMINGGKMEDVISGVQKLEPNTLFNFYNNNNIVSLDY